MIDVTSRRAKKPASYPDQAIYAEFAALSCDLGFESFDNGLVFDIASPTKRLWFGGGRCSYFPQNNATAATLAADKYLSGTVLAKVGIPTLGGRYFFLSDRHRAHRPKHHERDDAVAYFHALGGSVFVKPLIGSRGDFAQAVHDEAALLTYLDEVSRYYDSIIMQAIVTGDEYRILVLDDAILYSARKQPPFLIGDGTSRLCDLLAARDGALRERGISRTTSSDGLDVVLPAGECRPLPGRMNRSAGGDMIFEDPPDDAAAMAIKAVRTLGLRVGGVDVFTGIGGDAAAMRVIEVNANPSIRFLEDSGRDDLILAIWRHTFTAMGLLDV